MELLKPEISLSGFFAGLSVAEQSILMLDYDGTLAPFRVEREQAVPYPGVSKLLDKLVAAPRTRLVIISGRFSNDLLPLLGMNEQVEIWGSHGAERLMPDGRHQPVVLSDNASRGLEEARIWIEDEGLADCSEEKPASIAFHWRGLNEADKEKLARCVRKRWENDALLYELELHPFDGGLELRAAGWNKGIAVERVLASEESDVVAAYLGDDVTDEDAFEALGERGLKVLVREEARKTRADMRLVPPDELLSFLSDWLKAVTS